MAEFLGGARTLLRRNGRVQPNGHFDSRPRLMTRLKDDYVNTPVDVESIGFLSEASRRALRVPMAGLAPNFLRLTWTVKPAGSYQPCSVCKNAHHKCDGKRPCGRCTRLQRVSDCLGIARIHECSSPLTVVDPPSRKRGRPTIELYEEGQDPQLTQPVRTVIPDEAAIPLQVNPVSLKVLSRTSSLYR